jgi:hypothetical protein
MIICTTFKIIVFNYFGYDRIKIVNEGCEVYLAMVVDLNGGIMN